MKSLSSKSKKEKGQGLVEYALILVLVAIVVIAALMVLGPIIGNVFSKVNSSLSGAGAGGGSLVSGVSAPLTWGGDVFNNASEVCAAGGVSSGNTAYTWTANSSMSNGDTFYITGSSTAPASGYVLGGSTTCP